MILSKASRFLILKVKYVPSFHIACFLIRYVCVLW